MDLIPEPDPVEQPNSFVYLRGDGEQNSNSTSSDLEPIWKQFKIPLLDKHGAPHLDDDGEPITVIAKDLNSLHSTVFLTKPDEYREVRRAQVVELIGDFDKNLNDHEEQAKALQDLQYCVVYDHPSHLMNKKHGKQHYDFDRDNPDD